MFPTSAELVVSENVQLGDPVFQTPTETFPTAATPDWATADRRLRLDLAHLALAVVQLQQRIVQLEQQTPLVYARRFLVWLQQIPSRLLRLVSPSRG